MILIGAVSVSALLSVQGHTSREPRIGRIGCFRALCVCFSGFGGVRLTMGYLVDLL